MTLAAILLPLLPAVVESVMAIVRAIARHPDTPEDAAQQLQDIALQLDEVAARVRAVQVRTA